MAVASIAGSDVARDAVSAADAAVREPGRARRRGSGPRCSTAPARRSWPGRTSSATSSPARRARRIPEARGEVVRAAQILKYFAGVALQPHGQALDSVRPGIEVTVTREPVGVVSVITPWNFPIAIPAWKIAPALAFGNTVVFKPADLVPAQRVGARRHPQPGRVCRPACSTSSWGAARRSGPVLTGDPRVSAVTFTGSVDTGRGILTLDRRPRRQGAAGAGREEPAGGHRPRRPRRRRRVRDAGRLRLDRPALHGVVDPRRDRRHPRRLRRRDGRADARVARRRRARLPARHGTGRRRRPARAGPALPRRRPRRGRGHRRREHRSTPARRATSWRRRSRSARRSATRSTARRSSGR